MNELAGSTVELNQVGVVPNRMYKTRMFEMIFGQKEELLELYNAANDSDYDDPELLEINTLENAIYMAMHNDISFIIDSRLSLYEHQSTYNPNMPIRCLFYISDLYSVITKDCNLYSKSLVSLPTPRFLVFYNGEDEQPERVELKLSDAFIVKEAEVFLELRVTMLNINPGYNEKLKQACKTLADYTEYVTRVRRYAKKMPIERAVDQAIKECIEEGILAEFLRKNQAEARKVSIYEYDQEKHMKMEREEWYKNGLMEGIKSFVEVCKELGSGLQETLERLMSKFSLDEETAEEYLKKYW